MTTAQTRPEVRYFGHLEIALVIEGSDEDLSEREMFEAAQERIDFPTTYDLYIDHAADPEYFGERFVRCDRILVPPEALEDVVFEPADEEEESYSERAVHEITRDKRVDAAADWISEHISVEGMNRVPGFHIDHSDEWSENIWDPDEQRFVDGYDPEEGFDIERAIRQYDPTDAPWVEGEE